MSRGQLINLGYLVAAVCFIAALKGLSTPRTARLGNLVAAAGMVLAVLVTFALPGMRAVNIPFIVAAMVIGTGVGVPVSRRVAMTQMPQLVAAFNGVGGGAAALVSIAEFSRGHGDASFGVTLAVLFSTAIGCISFTGSALTFAKLQEIMTTRPVLLKGGVGVIYAVVVAVVALLVLVLVLGSVLSLALLAVASLALGVLIVLPVGGADVPIVISLLNAFTGLAVAASGAVLNNTLLIVAGTLVGASGALLTYLMSQAMGRSIANTMFGAFTATPLAALESGGEQRSYRTGTVDDVAIMLAYSRKVAIVPGYGLAVAQAQHTVRELADLLEERGVDVTYAIHPVAGRMPGHMNVLLAESNVPYDDVFELEQINSEFASADVAFVIGANDVTNPAAKTDKTSAIYGMPILEVEKAGTVLFIKRSMASGYAGVDNELFFRPNTMMLFGDAKKVTEEIVQALGK